MSSIWNISHACIVISYVFACTTHMLFFNMVNMAVDSQRRESPVLVRAGGHGTVVVTRGVTDMRGKPVKRVTPPESA